jgi:putative membrane protein
MVKQGEHKSRIERQNLNRDRAPQEKVRKGIFKKLMSSRKAGHRSFGEKFRIYRGEKLNWFQVVLQLKGPVLSGVLPWVGLCTAYSTLLALLNHFGYLPEFGANKSLSNIVISLNVVLSLLLVFRTNTAHERFWEGRKLWGAMVNVCRNLARGIWVILDEHNSDDRDGKAANARLVAAFSVAMKLHLRQEPMQPELMSLMSESQYHRLQQVPHAPLEISFWISDYLQQQYKQKRVNIFQVSDLIEMVDEMVDILGGCERILKTPLPLVYVITLKILLTVYFILLPLGLIQDLGWWTMVDIAFISFMIFSINEIGAEIEEPFGSDVNDLPLDLICNTITRNIQEMLTLSPNQCVLPQPDL